MQLFKRIGATILVVIIFVAITAPCFAVPAVGAVEALDLFGTLFTVYMSYMGLDLVLNSDGVDYGTTIPADPVVRRDMYQGLYDEYSASVNDTTVTGTTVFDWYTIYKAYLNISNKPNPSEPDDENGIVGLGFSAQLSEFFDKMANWLLKDKYNLVSTESGFQHTSGSFDSPLLALTYGYNSSMAGPWSNDLATRYQNCYVIVDGTTYRGFWNNGDDGIAFQLFLVGNSLKFVCGNPSGLNIQIQVGTAYQSAGGSGTVTVTSNSFTQDQTTGLYYAGIGNNGFTSSSLPSFNALDDGLAYFSQNGLFTSDNILVRPRRPDLQPIPVPDTDDVEYLPAPMEIPSSVPWTSTYTGADPSTGNQPFIDVLTDMGTDASKNTLISPQTQTPTPSPDAPTTVMPPFLPTDLPDVSEFNFSGIWYYVVRWVQSIGSGIGFLNAVWSSIPAAMFFPVYGTAVVCIVIGTWKRFFS